MERSKHNASGNGSNASEQVLEYIKTGIATQRWKVGDKLPTEQELCQILGVSRASVRPAIHQLKSLGMLKSIQGSGTYVCANETSPLNAITSSILLNQNDLLSMLEFRRMVELGSVELAAQRASTEEVSAMFRAAEQMQNAQLQEDIVRYDMEFHTLIAGATRNFAIIKVFEIMRESYLGILANNVAQLGGVGAREHIAIAAAVARRAPEKAKALMIEHLDYSASLYFDTESAR